jgi:hypothetical protein
MSSAPEPHRQVYDPKAPTADDENVQSTILQHLIDLYPAQLTITEVVRELTVASTDFSVVDQVERAICKLIRAGLIHRHGDFLFPTRAAVLSHEIHGL